jgi:hypothetical protein
MCIHQRVESGIAIEDYAVGYYCDDEVMARYEALKGLVIERKDGFMKLTEFVERETSYLTAPASIKYHLNRRGGLLEHSVNVAETLLKLRLAIASGETPAENISPAFPGDGAPILGEKHEAISVESCVIVALFHDLGKAGVPGAPQYIENEPSEKQKRCGYPANIPYRFNKDLVYMSVPMRSLYLILPRFPLNEVEAQAIMYHDGQYVDDNRSVAAKEEPLTLLLQYADNWSGFVREVE